MFVSIVLFVASCSYAVARLEKDDCKGGILDAVDNEHRCTNKGSTNSNGALQEKKGISIAALCRVEQCQLLTAGARRYCLCDRYFCSLGWMCWLALLFILREISELPLYQYDAHRNGSGTFEFTRF